MSDDNGALAPLIVNATAGRASLSSNLPFATAFERWRELYANHADVHLVEPQRIDATLEQLLDDGHERIAVAGGDGTSRRGRSCEREKNSFNLLSFEANGAITVEHWVYFSTDAGFSCVSAHTFFR